MEPFRYHAIVCTQQKSEGVPCCAAAGSFRVLNALHRELGAKGSRDEVQVSSCGCLGLCDSGPIMIVYPEGIWYTKLTPLTYRKSFLLTCRTEASHTSDPR